MPRYLFNPATNYTSGGGVTPVLLGGTGATTADGAATNLGFVKTSQVGAVNGVASLDGANKLVANVDWAKVSSGKPTTLSGYGITDAVALSVVGAANGVASLDGTTKVPLAQMPAGLGVSITGPTSVYVNQVVNYTINAFSTFTTYTITAVGGTFTRTNETISFTVTASAGGAANITVNGTTFTITVLASSVVAPSVTSPTNNATNVSLVPTFTSSAFAYLGMTQTQDSVRWEISTSSGFGTTVQTYEGASNYTSWTPTSLSVNTTYYVRVKHHSSLGGWSNWSAVVSFSTITSYGWVARLGGSGNDTFSGVACDSSGNIYAVGYESSSDGYNKPLITKWSSSGNLIWQRKINETNTFNSIAIDASDNIYAIGDDYRTNAEYSHGIVTKWDTLGELIWQKVLTRPSGQLYSIYFNAVTVDASGNVYVAGSNYDHSDPSYHYVYLTKWLTNGDLSWQRYVGVGSHRFYGVTCDTSGNVYAVGWESTFGSIIIKWGASGSILWQRKITNESANLTDVKLDSSGNIYIVSNSGSGAVVTKLLTNGDLSWKRKIGTSNNGFTGVIIDASDNIYAVGLHYTTTPVSDQLITKWNSSGDLIWQRKLAGNGWDQFNDIAIDASGNIYAVGNDVANSPNGDALITKWPSDVTNLPDGALSGSGMTSLSITNPTLTVTPLTDTTTAIGYIGLSMSMFVSGATLTAGTPTLTRYFSTF